MVWEEGLLSATVRLSVKGTCVRVDSYASFCIWGPQFWCCQRPSSLAKRNTYVLYMICYVLGRDYVLPRVFESPLRMAGWATLPKWGCIRCAHVDSIWSIPAVQAHALAYRCRCIFSRCLLLEGRLVDNKNAVSDFHTL